MATINQTAPPLATLAIAMQDWQTAIMVGIALMVSLYRIVEADPPLPLHKALASVMMGLLFTLVFAPVAGVWIANRLTIDSVNAVMIATIVVSVGWLKLYRVIETDIVDFVIRTLKAIFGVKE